MAGLHRAGLANARRQIDAGNVNETAPWSFDAADGDRLLGDDEDNPDWKRFSDWHLGREADADRETKAAWKFPFGKFDGDRPNVFRSALRAVAGRAAQTGDDEISEAASELIERIDERKESQGAQAFALPRLAARLYSTPLMIQPDKLDAILGVLGPRLLGGGPIAALDMDGPPAAQAGSRSESGIAVIPILGTLVMMAGGVRAASGLMSFGEIEGAFTAALEDPSVRGILLEIDSPGGEVNGVFDLADLIFAARGFKPIWAVANEMAFSAAFALASAADRIVLPRTAVLGSVGVVALHIDQSQLDKDTGLDFSFVFAGERKIDGNPHEPLSERARSELQEQVDAVSDIFAATVARGRGLSIDAVKATEARAFMGAEAVAAGFADAVMTFNDTLAALGAEASTTRRAFARGEAAKRIPERGSGAAPNNGGDKEKIMSDAKKPGDTPPAETAGAAKTPAPEPAPDNLVDLDKVRADARAAGVKDVSEIVNLCAIAGMSDLAKGFIDDGLSAEAVGKRLVDARAASSDKAAVASRHDGAPHDADAANNYGWDRAFARATGHKIA